MKKWEVYDLYIDDGESVWKTNIPAPTKKAAQEFLAGNGEVVQIKKSDLQDIDIDCLFDTLVRGGWGQAEINIITRTLMEVGLDRVK